MSEPPPPLPPHEEHEDARGRLTDHRRHRLPVVLAFLILLAGVGTLGWLGWTRIADGDAPATTVGGALTVEVVSGDSADVVARKLEEAGVISSATTFLVRLKLAGGGEEIKPGRYTFSASQDFDAILARLQEGGEVPTVRITLPEGLSIEQAAERVGAGTGISAESYERAARNPAAFAVPPLDGQPAKAADLEGYLFPDTYELAAGEGAEGLIGRQLEAFSQQTGGLPWENAEALGLTPYEVLVVASLIEKETRVPEERPLVAAVVYNRLEKDMTLGIDATVRFALGKWTGSLTKSDLEVDSPYNTRKKRGLPPGPIASPGMASLRAALEPAEVDYLYYVLVDEEGHHFFTASYDAFLEARKRIPASSR